MMWLLYYYIYLIKKINNKNSKVKNDLKDVINDMMYSFILYNRNEINENIENIESEELRNRINECNEYDLSKIRGLKTRHNLYIV